MIKNEGLVIPSSRMTLHRIKNLLTMVGGDVVRPAWLFTLPTNMVVFQALVAHFHLDMCCVHGAEPSIEARFFIFLHVSLQSLETGWGNKVLIVESCQAPEDKNVKKQQ